MKKYIRSEKYDSAFISQNWMGPNPLWLIEELCDNLDLKPGMRVLDMGCGKGLTSIFLAKEFGVTVFANDLWINATDNLERFKQSGVSKLVFPIHADAYALPYADGFFDAAIAVDCYHYFGACESYFPRIFSKLVKPGGQLGIVVPGLTKEFEKGYPDTLERFWNLYDGELFAFHSGAWWRKLWEKTGIADIVACYDIPDMKEIWMPWATWSDENMPQLLKECGMNEGVPGGESDVDFLNADINNELALIVMTAIKKE